VDRERENRLWEVERGAVKEEARVRVTRVEELLEEARQAEKTAMQRGAEDAERSLRREQMRMEEELRRREEEHQRLLGRREREWEERSAERSRAVLREEVERWKHEHQAVEAELLRLRREGERERDGRSLVVAGEERRVVELEGEVARVKSLVSVEHGEYAHKLAVVSRDADEWRRRCEAAVGEAERAERARAEVHAKYLMLGERVQQLIAADGEQTRGMVVSVGRERDALSAQCDKLRGKLDAAKQKHKLERSEARERLDAAQRRVSLLLEDLRLKTLEAEEAAAEREELRVKHARCPAKLDAAVARASTLEARAEEAMKLSSDREAEVRRLQEAARAREEELGVVRRQMERANAAALEEETGRYVLVLLFLLFDLF
jgi:hypothetical protein